MLTSASSISDVISDTSTRYTPVLSMHAHIPSHTARTHIPSHTPRTHVRGNHQHTIQMRPGSFATALVPEHRDVAHEPVGPAVNIVPLPVGPAVNIVP